MSRTYACIDLKSFYASVECVQRKLDPLKVNLVVADESRTQKTICLAVSPTLKSYGLSGRSRLYEVVSKVNEINKEKLKKVKRFVCKSYYNEEVINNDDIGLDFIIAPPRMREYMKYSTKIYNIYLKYISRDDIFAYSIDEVFMDLTEYLNYYKCSAFELISNIVSDVYKTTGITATAGIGTNMYLAKVAMDIKAKHMNPNKEGLRIAYLDEISYRKEFWDYKPLTDFWMIGVGTVRRLENSKMYTMGDIARMSLENEKLLYKIFGVNAETLIDHAWGYENATIKSVKSYKPSARSLSSGQVLHEPYDYDKTRLIVKEMTEVLVLDMVEKKYMTNLITLDIHYDIENLTNPNIKRYYHGLITLDHYGRYVPSPSHGSVRLEKRTGSTRIIMANILNLFDNIVNPRLLVRRINISFANLVNEEIAKKEVVHKQFDLFSNTNEIDTSKIQESIDEEEESKLQHAVIKIKNKYGRNAILKAMNLEEGATTISRNTEVGGHKG